jgi:hypothetical protein
MSHVTMVGNYLHSLYCSIYLFWCLETLGVEVPDESWCYVI